jgi:hypothetical protein
MYVCTHIQSCTAHTSYCDGGDGDIGSDGKGNRDQTAGQRWEYLGKQIDYAKTSTTQTFPSTDSFRDHHRRLKASVTGGWKLPTEKASHPEAFSRACFQQ